MMVWMWSLIAALLAVVVMQSSVVILDRMIGSTAKASGPVIDFTNVPNWQIWSFILMAAAVAGISEEVGFRGYMQVPLEGRYGPAVGITITSIVFVVFHLNQTWAAGAGILVILFAGGVMWGVIVLTSGSLIPAIISHIIVDIFSFSYWWTDFTLTSDKGLIGETGIDTHFIMWLVGIVASVLLFVFAVRKTLAARQET
jgi:membrane protease YdiL (CAAX protease family)